MKLLKKNKKWNLPFILYLCSLALIGVGFSAWQIGSEPISSTITNAIVTDSVVDATKYLSVNALKGTTKQGVDVLQYNSHGFVFLDEVVGYQGQMKYYLIFKMNDFYNDYTNYDYANLSFVYSYTSNGENRLLFDYITNDITVGYLFGNSGNYTTTPTLLSCSSLNQNNQVTTSVSLQSFDRNTYDSKYSTKYMYLEITYLFDAVDENTYSLIYNDLEDTNFTFTFNVFLEGCEKNEIA